MIYEESETVELKRKLEDDMKGEIIAFLNSYLGGTIYVGVEDDGTLVEANEQEKDINESRVINWIRDEAIYPNCSDYVHINYNEDHVLVIQVEPGHQKPYYIKSKGLKPSGVYIRYGRNKSQATPEEIANFLRESNDTPYESRISRIQDLTFYTLEKKYEQKNLNFKDFKFVTSGFLDSKSNLYTNVAYIFSDQYPIETKIAVYQGSDREVFKSKKEFSGSIIQQIDEVIDYCDLCNDVKVVIDGSAERIEIPSYEKNAIREAILNCYCHRNYEMNSNIKIEFFDDRLEIISPGNLYGGLTLEEALTGSQSFRNEYVTRLLFRLGYIENYASGLLRIMKSYQRHNKTPLFEPSMNRFKVVLPNINYGDTNGIVEVKKVSFDAIGNQRDKLILETIQTYPGLQAKDLLNILITLDPQINYNILNKRIRSLSNYIERRGSKKTGGYYIKAN